MFFRSSLVEANPSVTLLIAAISVSETSIPLGGHISQNLGVKQGCREGEGSVNGFKPPLAIECSAFPSELFRAQFVSSAG